MRKRTLITGAVAIGVAATVGIAGTVVAQAQETGDEALGQAIDAILADDRLTDSQAGVVVRDAATGDVVYDHNGNFRALPGSNNKILTSAAALESLGTDYTYTTEAAAESEPSGGTVAGDLFLRGTGDPTMLAEDYDAMAEALAADGVTAIEGDLVADDTAFDDERIGLGWSQSDLEYLYAAEVSALTVASSDDYNAGTVRVSASPGAGEGDEAEVSMEPANDYVTIDNQVTTGAAGSETSVSVNRDDLTGEMVLTGTIAADADATSATRAVLEPTGLAADVFKAALEDHGITLNGDVVLGGETPEGASALASHESMPLSEMVVHFLKRSNSSHAEALLKTMGYEASGEGTYASGKAAIYAALEKYGVDTGPIAQVDGSGLSRQNWLTPDMITDLLIGAKNDAPWFDTWYEALPIACESDQMVGGTLRNRMCDTPAASNVHGKTGSLTGVSGLSGYVTDADGRELVFSVLTNDYLYSSVKDIEDKIAAAIAGHSESATEAEIENFSNMEKIETPPEDDPNAELECTWVEPAVC